MIRATNHAVVSTVLFVRGICRHVKIVHKIAQFLSTFEPHSNVANVIVARADASASFLHVHGWTLMQLYCVVADADGRTLTHLLRSLISST